MSWPSGPTRGAVFTGRGGTACARAEPRACRPLWGLCPALVGRLLLARFTPLCTGAPSPPRHARPRLGHEPRAPASLHVPQGWAWCLVPDGLSLRGHLPVTTLLLARRLWATGGLTDIFILDGPRGSGPLSVVWKIVRGTSQREKKVAGEKGESGRRRKGDGGKGEATRRTG